MDARTRQWIHRGVLAIGLAPAAALGVAAATSGLGANPAEAITHTTGEFALRWLIVSLAITPLRRLFGWNALAPYRKTFGLLAFAYACAHVLNYFVLDLSLDFGFLWEDIVERPYITVGALAFLAMLPLALTSTRGMQRRLGRRWIALHRLSYVAAILAIVHFAWLVKADLGSPIVHGAVLAVLLGARFFRRDAPA